MKIKHSAFASDRVYLTWRDLWKLIIGRTVTAPGIIVTREGKETNHGD
jgi:hypothetical protein